jgi:hypothetical protein
MAAETSGEHEPYKLELQLLIKWQLSCGNTLQLALKMCRYLLRTYFLPR